MTWDATALDLVLAEVRAEFVRAQRFGAFHMSGAVGEPMSQTAAVKHGYIMEGFAKLLRDMQAKGLLVESTVGVALTEFDAALDELERLCRAETAAATERTYKGMKAGTWLDFGAVR